MPNPAENIRYSSFSCIQCGYNLTGIVIGGHCPECGCLVERSLATSGLPTNGHAIASMVLGICSIILFCGPGIVCGLLGLIIGAIAIKEIRDKQYDHKSKGMAIAGIICSGLGILAFIWFVWNYIY